MYSYLLMSLWVQTSFLIWQPLSSLEHPILETKQVKIFSKAHKWFSTCCSAVHVEPLSLTNEKKRTSLIARTSELMSFVTNQHIKHSWVKPRVMLFRLSWVNVCTTPNIVRRISLPYIWFCLVLKFSFDAAAIGQLISFWNYTDRKLLSVHHISIQLELVFATKSQTYYLENC